MNNKKKYLKNLWRMKTLKELENVEIEFGEGMVTRSCISDNRRAIKFIEYGFEEGIKFAKLVSDEEVEK